MSTNNQERVLLKAIADHPFLEGSDDDTHVHVFRREVMEASDLGVAYYEAERVCVRRGWAEAAAPRDEYPYEPTVCLTEQGFDLIRAHGYGRPPTSFQTPPVTIAVIDGDTEYRVPGPDGTEAQAYYTDDPEDAKSTARTIYGSDVQFEWVDVLDWSNFRSEEEK